MLRDLEELLHRIEDDASREYMREAVLCYHGGAYRACVVIAVAAGMDDLRRKLHALAHSGGASKAVKTADALVDGMFKKPETFENTLLDQARLIDLITPAQEEKLRTIQKTRHLCGHPSGHVGSPEEARAAIAAMVDLVMSQPALLGMSAVEDLLIRLAKANFFPKTDDPAIRGTLERELKGINPLNFPALIARAVAELADLAKDARTPAKEAGIGNIVAMLGAAITMSALRAEVWRRIDKLLAEPVADAVSLQILGSSDASGLKTSPALNRDRAVALVRRNLLNAHARNALRSWRKEGAIDKADEGDFVIAGRELALMTPPGPDVTAAVIDLGPTAYEPYFARLAEGAGGSTWEIADPAIAAMQALTEEQASLVTEQQQIDYLKGIASHEGRPYPAREASRILRHGLGERIAFAEANVERLLADAGIADRGKGLARLLRASDLREAATAVDEAVKAVWNAMFRNMVGKEPPKPKKEGVTCSAKWPMRPINRIGCIRT